MDATEFPFQFMNILALERYCCGTGEIRQAFGSSNIRLTTRSVDGPGKGNVAAYETSCVSTPTYSRPICQQPVI